MFKRHCENCDTKMDCILVESDITIYWCKECGIVLTEDKYGDDWNKPESSKWSLMKNEELVDEQHYNIMLENGNIIKDVEFWAFGGSFIASPRNDINKDISISKVIKFQKGIKEEIK